MSEAYSERNVIPQLTKRAEEYGEVDIPLPLILRDGHLNVYPDVLRRNFFKIYNKGDRLALQAGGWIGVLPISPSVAIEIVPRIPIGNLEQIILISQELRLEAIHRKIRLFNETPTQIPSLVDLFANRIIEHVENIRIEGVHYDYQRHEQVGTSPSGRINPFRTALHRSKLVRSPKAVYEIFERSYNNLPNRYIKQALQKIYSIYRTMPNRAGRMQIIRRIESALETFRSAADGKIRSTDIDKLLGRQELFSPVRRSYPSALVISRMILLDRGIEIRTSGGSVELPHLLVNMEEVFEAYLRQVLKRELSEFSVRNGNHSAPVGARKPLMDSVGAGSSMAGHAATPDIVVLPHDGGQPCLIVEVKYKPIKDSPSREDLNQAIVYGAAYRCKIVCLTFPRRSKLSVKGIVHLGVINNIKLYLYFIDLNAADLSQEELAFSTTMREISYHSDVPAGAN